MTNITRASAAALVASSLAVGIWVDAAQAQFQPRPSRPEPREGESYEPIGLPVGGFRLFPAFEIAEFYDTNIFATESREQDDLITVFRPSLNLRSNWNNHMLNLFASATAGVYADHGSENYEDFRAGFDGRVDIQRNWNVYGGIQFSKLHDERGEPNTEASFRTPNEYNLWEGKLGYYQKFNRFSVRAEGLIDDVTYTNNKGAGPGTISNRDRDRREYTETLRLGYEFIERYEIWVQGGLNQRVYDRRVDSGGFERSSNGWEVVGGATIDFGGITQVEFFAGYREQKYDDARLGTIRGPIFGLAGYWNPLVTIVVRPYVKRTIEETILLPFAGYWSTVFGVDVDYDFRPNIKVTAGASYSMLDYKKARGVPGTFSRDDDYMRFSIGVRYQPTENFYIGPSYRYISRSSNIGGADYGRHVFGLRGGVQL